MTDYAEASAIGENEILVLTVGTSVEPIIKTIDDQKPVNLVTIASEQTKDKLDIIFDKCEWKGIKNKDEIIIPDADNIVECARVIRKDIKKFLNKRDVPQIFRFYADITGGTKAMVAALTLVMIEYNCKFSYVGGSQRDPEKRHIVVSGTEIVKIMDDPWDAMGMRFAKNLTTAFNAGNYGTALRLAKERCSTISKESKQIYLGIENLMEAFCAWDRFEYDQAVNNFNNAYIKFAPIINLHVLEFKNFMRSVENYQKYAQNVAKESSSLAQNVVNADFPANYGRMFLLDLIANAERRANLKQYDDAVARLYSAVEKSAKIALAKLGKNNSKLTDADLTEIPEELRKRIMENKSDKGDFYAIPLWLSVDYLSAIDPENPLAIGFSKNRDNLEKELQYRNQSLLAHGYLPVDESKYKRLRDIVYKLLDIKEEELVKFPQLSEDYFII